MIILLLPAYCAIYEGVKDGCEYAKVNCEILVLLVAKSSILVKN
jgi:hypothetical protein